MTIRGAALAFACGVIAVAAAAADKNADAWKALSVGLDRDAREAFDAAGMTPETELGQALARINAPPVSRASLADVRARLEKLAPRNDGTGHAARYFLGRLAQLDPFEPDFARAVQEYDTLVRGGADDAWTRLALVKRTILQLSVIPPTDDTTRFDAAEKAFQFTRDATTIRDLHVVIAEARLSARLYDPRTLDHLRAALAGTSADDLLRPDLLVQTARLATMTGAKDIARENFLTFTRDYPKDRRLFTVQSALARLDGVSPP